MNRKQSVRKIVPKKRAKKTRKPSAAAQKANATTMQIPVDAIFDDFPSDHSIHLKVTIAGKKPFTVPLDETESIMGRDSHCAIYLPISNVSREHAKIIRNGEVFSVEDLDSTNGTFVNNVSIVSCVLHHSDQIRVGKAHMTFVRVNTGTGT
jgi:pSer/pThr/pTyr-binding forkhead associated (FHA) protein